MNNDLSPLLQGWAYDPGNIVARWIIGRDGHLKVQLRLDLGILQMEPEGRPDGQRPGGYPSLLDYHRAREAALPPGEPPPKLDAAECAELQQEAMQYYYRYLAFQALRHYRGVLHDTTHNLGILELVERRAPDEHLAWQFLQFYPYIRMMNARAAAEQDMNEQHYAGALAELQEAMADIRAFWARHGDGEVPASSPELEALNDLLGRVRSHQPKTRREKLREELDRAIASEDYEQAAHLRDELRKIGES